MTGYRTEDGPFAKKYVDVDVNVNVKAKEVKEEAKELPESTEVRSSSDLSEDAGIGRRFYKAKEVVIDGVVVKSRYFPVGMTVLVVPQPEDRLARCQHNNFAGECLVCYQMEAKAGHS